ncbi:MAG: D-aminoacyl-tRNA deacylase [Bradymonadaceae bacterium]
MRVLLQRVSQAAVRVDDEIVGEIGHGLLAFVAAGEGDGAEDLAHCVDKTVNLRIFADEEGKMNRSVLDVGGAVLAVPQFTLYGDVSKGRRPSFFEAMDPGPAEEMFEEYVEAVVDEGVAEVESGTFGAMMDVDLVNDGPVTIWIDSSS